MLTQELVKVAKHAARLAGEKILEVYHSGDFSVESKTDRSPLTLADKAAHHLIAEQLEPTGIPILSEEGKAIPFEERQHWEWLWIVDPLDGTKEFIKKNGEFTVNIALVYQGQPVMGVVFAPVLDQLFYNDENGQSFVESGTEKKELKKKPDNNTVKTIVASRSHLSADTEDFIRQYPDAQTLSMGSSLKFMLLAEGKAQAYPRFAPTMEWDTAAAHAVLKALGYEVTDQKTGAPMIYNREHLLNNYFLAQ